MSEHDYIREHYKRATVTFDGYVSEYNDTIYLYTDLPTDNGTDEHAAKQAGVLNTDLDNLTYRIEYKAPVAS